MSNIACIIIEAMHCNHVEGIGYYAHMQLILNASTMRLVLGVAKQFIKVFLIKVQCIHE